MRVPMDAANRAKATGVLRLRSDPNAELRAMMPGTELRIIPVDGDRELPGYVAKFQRLEGRSLYLGTARAR